VKLPDEPGGFGVIERRTDAPSHGIGVAPDGKTLWVTSITANGVFAYSLPDLPIGDYTLTAAANGFSQVQEKVKIGVGERIRLDLHLAVGAANQTVEVNATGLNLQRDDASIGMLVTSGVIEETPLYLRNWDDLLRVVPGVQIARYTDQSGATSAGRTGDFNVNGVHSLQNNFLLDGVDNNSNLPDLLNEFGYSVRTFSSALEFLASDALEQSKCLILDITMPGMTGIELQAELKRHDKRIPIIFITGTRDEAVRARVVELGAAACLTKPFSDPALLEALRSVRTPN